MTETISIAEYKALRKRPKSTGEELLTLQLKTAGIKFKREFKFHPDRKWRSDFFIDTSCWLSPLLVEVEGGTYINGRHSRGESFRKDCEKYAEATILGYRIMRFTTQQVKEGYTLDCIKRALK